MYRYCCFGGGGGKIEPVQPSRAQECLRGGVALDEDVYVYRQDSFTIARWSSEKLWVTIKQLREYFEDRFSTYLPKDTTVALGDGTKVRMISQMLPCALRDKTRSISGCTCQRRRLKRNQVQGGGA